MASKSHLLAQASYITFLLLIDVGSALELAGCSFKDGLLLSYILNKILAITPALYVVLYYSKMGSHYSLAASPSFGIAAPNANIISGFPPFSHPKMCAPSSLAPFACLLLPSRACDVVVVPLSSASSSIFYPIAIAANDKASAPLRSERDADGNGSIGTAQQRPTTTLAEFHFCCAGSPPCSALSGSLYK